MSDQKNSRLQTILGAIVAVALLWYFIGGGLQKQATKDLQGIHDQVAGDAVKQYEMARRSGTAIDICVQAGLVGASYLQAKDESNYQRWKQTESSDCASAGVPR